MHRLWSLRGKILIFTFGIVVVLTGLSLAVIHEFVAGQVQRQVEEELKKTQTVFEMFMQERARWLRSQCEVVARDPRFIAPLDIQSPQLEYQAQTVLREARRFQSVIGSDVFIVTDRAGRVLTRLEISSVLKGGLGRLSTVAAGLRGEQMTGKWTYEGREFQVATVPIWEGDRVLGTLSMGFLESGDVTWYLEALGAASQDELIRKPVLAEDWGAVAALAREILEQSDSDLVAITDHGGEPFGLAIRRAGYGEDISRAPRFREALDGRLASGLQADRGQIVQMVVVPVYAQGEFVGTLGTGFDVDDRLARELRSMTDSEISFVLDGDLVASTWPQPARRELMERLSAPGGRPPDRAGPFEMQIGDETYLSLLGRLEDIEGEGRAFYLIQFSLDRAIGFLTTIEQVLLMIGGGVLLAAALISFTGGRRITRPVRALVEGTRRLAAGELSHRIAVDSRDEIGELADSFNEMAAALTRSRDALAESERRYRDLFDNAQDIVYTTDMNMRLTSVNKAAAEFTGYAAAELVGRSFYDLLTPDDARRLRETEERYLPGTARAAVEVEVVRKEGELVALEIVSRWIMEGGLAVGVHGIGRDITQRKEREAATERFREQLHQAEKLRALGEMAAGVAHNFNNLLTGVIGYAELMKLRDDVPDPVLANAQKIVESARRCSAIVRRIQTFGRPIDPSQTERVDLNQVVRDTVDITRAKWRTQAQREGKQVRVDLDLADGLPPVQSVGSAWEEILSNLIFNAVDAMPEGGTITLGTRLSDGEVLVTVADTGIGMDEETRRRVFEPFFTTKAPDRGSGLGLSTVWGLVQGQGGRVEIQSAPGTGTTFTVRVPARLMAEEASPEREAGLSAVTGLRVLVVDDDPAVRDFLPSLLRGQRVDTAANGLEGLERFHRTYHDLVICDWVMPGMSGLEVAERVKQMAPQTVTVLMTGWEYQGTAVDNSSAIDLIVSKPFDAEKLHRALQPVLRRAAAPVAGQQEGGTA